MSKKRNVAVLFGGCSPEYSLSLESARVVIRHMDEGRYAPILIGISPSGKWFHYTGQHISPGDASPGCSLFHGLRRSARARDTLG